MRWYGGRELRNCLVAASTPPYVGVVAVVKAVVLMVVVMVVVVTTRHSSGSGVRTTVHLLLKSPCGSSPSWHREVRDEEGREEGRRVGGRGEEEWGRGVIGLRR